MSLRSRRITRPLISLAAALTCLLALSTCASAQTTKTYDLIIAGAGTGGVSAAIQAARMGVRVALLEESDWIGGQATAAAVSTMDEFYTNLNSGIYNEFWHRVKAYYAAQGKSIGTCYWSEKNRCFEPAVGQKILYQMMDDARHAPGVAHPVLDLYLRTKVVRVLSAGNRVTGVVTSTGLTLHSDILVDATEYGDVLPLTPASYRISHFTGKNADPAECIQDITYVAVIKKYPGGVPPELWMKDAPPGYTQALRQRFERELRRDGNPVTRLLPVNFAMHNAYRGLPDSSNPANYTALTPNRITKSELNWFNDYHANVAYLQGSERRKINCEAKLRTLQLLYYVQHDLGEKLWSVANDQGFDTPYNRTDNACDNIPVEFKAIERQMPPMPYVRESIRLMGEHTLTAGEIRREGTPPVAVTDFPTSIAVNDYADDLHGCNKASDLEGNLEHLSDRPPGFRGGRLQVPIESLIPATTDGLLAAEKNISETRLANGATRLQPSTMLVGQAVGTLAALAIQQGVQPRQVDPVLVQRVLLQAGSSLSLHEYSDVARDSALWPAVEMVTTHRWMAGASSSQFGVGAPLSRREAAIILAQRFGLYAGFNSYREPDRSHAAFRDVPLYDTASIPVEALKAAGVVTGCTADGGRFCPDRSVTRAEFVTMLARLLHLPATARSQPVKYLDLNSAAPAYTEVNAAAQAGLLPATIGRFRPDEPITRAEVAALLYRTTGPPFEAQMAATRRRAEQIARSGHPGLPAGAARSPRPERSRRR